MENFNIFGSVIFPYTNWIVFLILAYLLFKKPLLSILAAKRQNFQDSVWKASDAKIAAFWAAS